MYLVSRRYSPPKRRVRRAFGTLLLALPLCGIALQLPSAQAQPAPNLPNGPAAAALSPQQKSEIERVMSISHNEDVCKLALDLKLKNASIEEVTARIKATFPNQQIEIRQRDARPLKVSLDLKETTVGSVLTGVAALSDCRLWVLPDSLLIAPPGKLSTIEHEMVKQRMAGEWAQSFQAGGHGWSNETFGEKVFAQVVAQEVKASNKAPDAEGNIKSTFGQFSPEGQQALRQLANWTRGSTRRDHPNAPPFVFSSDSPITVTLTDPKWVNIRFDKGASDPYSGMIDMGILID